MRKLLIIFLTILVSTEAIANFDVTIEIKELHVKNIAGLGDNPDVLVVLKLHRPEPNPKGQTRYTWATPVAIDQVVGDHPHEGYKFVCTHADPITIVWDIWDVDLILDDYMDGGRADLTIGDPFTIISRMGTYTDIVLEIKQAVSQCGLDKDTMTRDLSNVLNTNTSSSVTLNFHIREVDTPSLITLYEEIPTGFTFENANPTPTSVNQINDDGGLDLTMVRWDFVSPPGGLSTITYNVTTPPTFDQMVAGTFGAQIDVDGQVLYPNANDIKVTVDIPTVSEWGLIVMAGLLLTVGAVAIQRRFKTVSA